MQMIRREKKRLQKSGKFRTMTPARDGTLGLNPLLTAESRLIASLNRMLKSLGLSPSREESSANRRPLSAPAPPGFQWARTSQWCGTEKSTLR